MLFEYLMENLTIGQKFIHGITRTGLVEEVFNMILVLEGVRKACLIQPIDVQYNRGKTLKRVLKLADFYNLKKVECDQGILIMKKSTLVPFNLYSYSEKEFGEFLSFPYAGDIVNKRYYRYMVMLELFNNVYEPIAMVSSGERSESVCKFEQDIDKVVAMLNSDTSLQHTPIRVWSAYEKIYSIEQLIKCVEAQVEIDKSVISAIQSAFDNYGVEYKKNDSRETILKKLTECKIFFSI